MKIVIDRNKCIGCQACIKHCPMEAIHMFAKAAKIKEDRCTKCKACIQHCLLDAILVK